MGKPTKTLSLFGKGLGRPSYPLTGSLNPPPILKWPRATGVQQQRAPGPRSMPGVRLRDAHGLEVVPLGALIVDYTLPSRPQDAVDAARAFLKQSKPDGLL